jgi:hypothetical protein
MKDRERETTEGKTTFAVATRRNRREAPDLPLESLSRTLGLEGAPRRATGGTHPNPTSTQD